MNSSEFEDRQRGCFIGLAVGDALGAAIEFQRPGTFDPITDYRAGGPHGLEAGQWTDDTSMALALADSLIERGWDLTDQARRYVQWWRQGIYSVNGKCFDIGHTTRTALSRFERTGDARSSGIRLEEASGNGSIMRLAPVAIRYLDLFPKAMKRLSEMAAESSQITHASSQCVAACRYFALVLAGLMQGLERDVVLAPDWDALKLIRRYHGLQIDVDRVARGSYRQRNPPEIRGTGHVVASLEAALWAFHRAKSFQDAVLAAVNLGEDADTTGAVCGQLAGAYWGESQIPEHWREGLARRDQFMELLGRLIERNATA